MAKISVDESVLRGAISEIEKLRGELEALRGETKASLSDAIAKSLKNAGTAGRDNVVGDIDTQVVHKAVKDDIFKSDRVAKQRTDVASKKQSDRAVLRAAQGLRSESPSDAFYKSRGIKPREGR